MAADKKELSLGDKISACFKDVFKSCFNFDKTNKIDPGDRKNAKLDLIEVSTEKEKEYLKEVANRPPPDYDSTEFRDHATSSGDHIMEDPQHYSSQPARTRRSLPSMDSFEFSEEDSDYWKQAREVMKRDPSKSSMQRQNSNRRNSKLVRFGSVVRKFDKLEELFQEQDGAETEGEYYDEGSFDDGGYTDEDLYYYDQTTDTDHGQYSIESNEPYEHYDQSGYQYQDQYAQQDYRETYGSYQQPNTHANANWESSAHSYSGEQTQLATTSNKASRLSRQGSSKERQDRQVGGVVPSASYRKPLQNDEYKVDIRARVRALESGQGSQQFTDSTKKSNISSQDHLPIELSLPNYEAVKAAHAARIGEPLYTHPGGYKFRIDLWANGKGLGVNTHISVTVQSLEGENNANLQFPVKFIIILELLNQYSDYNHHVKEIECFYREGSYNTEIGRDLKFIPKENIYWNAEKRTQYVLNDVLRFRLTRITLV